MHAVISLSSLIPNPWCGSSGTSIASNGMHNKETPWLTGVMLTGIKPYPSAFTDKYTQFNNQHSVMKTCVPVKSQTYLSISCPIEKSLEVYNCWFSRIHNNQVDTWQEANFQWKLHNESIQATSLAEEKKQTLKKT